MFGHSSKFAAYFSHFPPNVQFNEVHQQPDNDKGASAYVGYIYRLSEPTMPNVTNDFSDRRKEIEIQRNGKME